MEYCLQCTLMSSKANAKDRFRELIHNILIILYFHDATLVNRAMVTMRGGNKILQAAKNLDTLTVA